MNNLILEIGTEEIPSSYIKPALEALSLGLMKHLDLESIKHGLSKIYGTPNRLSVVVENIHERQEVVTEEVTGPPKRAAYDKDGRPTIVAEKFAERLGLTVADLKVKKTEKGEYLFGMLTKGGGSSGHILKRILPEIILSIPFPKTMRWGGGRISFARPIHSILALIGTEIISFSLGEGIESSDYTYGHKIMFPEKIRIGSEKEYISSLRNAYVIADIDERRKILTESIEKIASSKKATVFKDDSLIETVTQLVEYPVAVSGKIDREYLDLPHQILVTAMREHQKYFAVVDEKGDLMPHFIAVNNTQAEDLAVVSKGHERVLRARLSDAKFFYESDLKVSNDQRVEKLKKVLFLSKLGTLYDKTLRVRSFAQILSECIRPEATERIKRAAYLCKSDLVSHVVGEFANLQGIMGRIYADHSKEEKAVSAAIEEHHQPIYSGGKLPDTAEGSILAIADKLDTILGCFYAGFLPSGASDPYALRRQGIGIIQIVLSRKFPVSFRFLIENGLIPFLDKDNPAYQAIFLGVSDFLEQRLLNILLDEGYSKDVVQAVLGADIPVIPAIPVHVKALESLKKQPYFDPLAVTFKRVVNILRKSAPEMIVLKDIDVNEALFQSPCESDLYSAYQRIEERVKKKIESGDVKDALIAATDLRSYVDRFFDGVMVMTDDNELRKNRLALLCVISKLFGRFADFSKITTV